MSVTFDQFNAFSPNKSFFFFLTPNLGTVVCMFTLVKSSTVSNADLNGVLLAS